MRGPPLLAEAIGTFLLVFIGPGAAAVDVWSSGAVSHVGVALAFGFVLLAVIYGLGHVSGAHFNPAVTLAFWSRGRFRGRDVIPYLVAQLVGSALAAGVLRLILGTAVIGAVTRPSVGLGGSLSVEVVLSFFLMLIIMAVATDARVAGPVAGLAVGVTVASGALMGGPLTGASMNPARSFGPSLVTGEWSGHWLYWVGPLAGTSLAGAAYDYLRKGSFDGHR